MQTLESYTQEYYPQATTRPVADYIKIAYLLAVVVALEARLVALEPKPRTVATRTLNEENGVEFKWPPSPLICHCEDFMGGGFECDRCGGMRF